MELVKRILSTGTSKRFIFVVVFCTTVKNRTQHLRQTLPVNLENNRRSKFIVVDYGNDDPELTPFLASFTPELESGRLIVYRYEGSQKFRMAHAKNMAHRLGIMHGGDILVNLDADNFAGEDFESYAEEVFASENVFMFSQMVKGAMTRGVGGRIAVRPRDFLKVGGYDEQKFNGWGSDDKDFNIRLKKIGYEAIEIRREFLVSVTHNDKMRFKEYPELHSKEEEYFKIYWECIEFPVVNFGRIGCGTVYRNFDRDDTIDIKPIPTRVFGIGYPKTGTKSLEQAFIALGYDSWHWSGAHVAKAIWREMNNDGRSSTLEKHSALCDLPIPLLYKKLDAVYQGAKFILTIRNEERWLRSIQRHFDSEYNPWRSGWDNDPFSNRVHHLAFGKIEFDSETFIRRYRQHNSEVMEYFKHRPDRLLVMHLDKNQGWENLCRFLDKPIPTAPFPHLNKS